MSSYPPTPEVLTTPLNALYKIYLEAATWFPRGPVKLITHETVQHPKLETADPHPISVYTIYGPDKLTKEETEEGSVSFTPEKILAAALPLTCLTTSVTDLDSHKDDEDPDDQEGEPDEEDTHILPRVPQLADLHTLATAYAHMNMCDIPPFAFLDALRTILAPHGITVAWLSVVPSLRRDSSSESTRQPPFYIRPSSDFTIDSKVTMPYHSVFLLTLPTVHPFKPDMDLEYIVDFAIPQSLPGAFRS
ncbi:hypothetical protein DM02DRAFT_671433 [Periconia macrospinosa]|uniref:Uncharacterized protein n=1 Tax=Periconia macrospinosa TaxID=97972 RepID=A0A2V1DT29_9PLEO|nr:hypothetical protein DM02DRAFT_671433 [Periconia macrospinosa]